MVLGYLMEKLDLAHFWDEDVDCYLVYNDEGIEFTDFLETILADYTLEKIEYDVTEKQAVDSPGYDAYSVAIAVAYLDRPKVEVESIIFTTCVY